MKPCDYQHIIFNSLKDNCINTGSNLISNGDFTNTYVDWNGNYFQFTGGTANIVSPKIYLGYSDNLTGSFSFRERSLGISIEKAPLPFDVPVFAILESPINKFRFSSL